MKLHDTYYYFSTHTINDSIYSRLEAGAEYEKLPEEEKALLDKLESNYPSGGDFSESPLEYCSKFIKKHNIELSGLISKKGVTLKSFLTRYLGYVFQWGASTRSFGKNSTKRAEEISEQELIMEMKDPKGSIKKLLDSSGGNLSSVKPFLPAIMVSLKTNTRNKSLMTYGHTGIFCFDFDKLEDLKEARKWMTEVTTKGTKHIKPYMGFISPRGKGFKIFCRVNLDNPDFIRDFGLEERDVVMKHHKVWYEGARKELCETFPKLEDKIDVSTNDPQRLTYLPFIEKSASNFYYNPTAISEYSVIVNEQRRLERKELLDKIAQNSVAIDKIMKEQNISNKEDAYHLLLKGKQADFDIDLETEKFIKVVDFIEALTFKDDRVANWVYDKFNDYHTLHKISWVLYGVFGDLAIDQIKRLIPSDSNKLDESNNDYRWAIRSKDDYDEEQLSSLRPGAFYALVSELGEVKDFLSDNFRISSSNVTEFKLINDYYETYIRNKDLYEKDDDNANLSEFLDEITAYLDKKKVRLPLIEELDSLTSEIQLGPEDYLDKATMEQLLVHKYTDKRIFSLRSQCGTGKNSISGHPKYKMPGRVILAEPYKGISDQIASEAWENQDRPNQLFVNSNIENTLRSFKKTDKETIRVNYETSLRGASLPTSKELVIHSTYNQILNISYEDLATFDYIFIDEAHTLSDGLHYRSDVIAGLIYYLVEFVARKVKSKTKIIFMSGTPNVETHVIPELMADYNIKNLFQRIIVKKEYRVEPTIHLTHLDTKDSLERQNAVIDQINTYIKQGRKVCHIFNNKSKMDQYIREIQSKLSDKIKVGLFYSGSTGDCTRNILSGKIGDFDVILTTTYFINGINIEKDGLSEEDIAKGKASTQKYGVVIDLGKHHTKVNAMDAIQAINRFRNRRCHTTIFLPKIFKPDLNNTSRSFEFRTAGKVLLGINRYNYHLLSAQTDLDPFEEEEEEKTPKLHLLDSVRLNPLLVSTKDINKSTKDEENRERIVNMILKKSRLYEDWFCSLDGYHYLAKDAGFLSIIKHKSPSSNLKEMTEEQLALENKVVENFLNDDAALDYLEHQIDPSKRVFVKSSGKITDPMSTKVENLEAVDFINDKYVIEGDFHISHERALNHLMSSHLKLSYWYGADLATDILRFILNPRVNIMMGASKNHLSNISKYVKGCRNSQLKKMLPSYSYIRGLDILSQKNIGVHKHDYPTHTSYTIQDPDLVNKLKDSWADFQYEMTMFKIDNSDSKEKSELKGYYGNKDLVKEYDISELHNSLNYLGDYKPFRFNKNGLMTRPEEIHIPKVIKSTKLTKLGLETDYTKWEAPPLYTISDFETFYQTKISTLYKEVELISLELAKSSTVVSSEIDKVVLPNIKVGKLLEAKEATLLFIETITKLGLPFIKQLNKVVSLIKNLNEIYYNSFKTGESTNFSELQVHNRVLFLDKLFYCDDSFTLESLDPGFVSVSKTISKQDIYVKLYQTYGKKNLRYEERTAWVALDDTNKVVVAALNKSEFAKELCKYAFLTKPFLLESGSPVKNFNKGIYNPLTFIRDYLVNSDPSKKLLNYTIQIIPFLNSDYKLGVKGLK